MSDLSSVVDVTNFNKIPISVIIALNEILFGEKSKGDRQAVLRFTKLAAENVENAERTLGSMDISTVKQIAEIVGVSPNDEHVRDEVFKFFFEFGDEYASGDGTLNETRLENNDDTITSEEDLKKVLISQQQQLTSLEEQKQAISLQQQQQQSSGLQPPQQAISLQQQQQSSGLQPQQQAISLQQQQSSGLQPQQQSSGLQQHQHSSVLQQQQQRPNDIQQQQAYLMTQLQQQIQQLNAQLQQQQQQMIWQQQQVECMKSSSGAPPSVLNSNPNTTHTACEPTVTLDFQKLMTRQILGTDLPTFDGGNMEWPTFVTEYNRTTQECGYSQSENMNRLRKCLVGKARGCVEMLLYTSEATRVMEILRRNFGETDVIMDQVMGKIRNFQQVTDSKSFLEFVNFVENLTVIVHNFGGNVTELNSKSIFKKLILKLPDYMRMQCANYMAAKRILVPTIIDLSEWANSQHEAIKMFEIGTKVTPKQYPPAKDSFPPKEDIPNTSSKQLQRPTDVKPNSNCKVCNGNTHPIEKCPEFLKSEPQKRWTIARNIHVCYSCLKKHHGPCAQKSQCNVNGCQRFHNKMLHKPDAPSTSNPVGSTTSITNSVILKTIPVTVKGPKGQVEIVAFLDDGSTVTMIDEKITTLLGIDGPVHPLCCIWTGDISRTDEKSKQVSLELIRSDASKTFKLDKVRTFQNLLLPKQNIDTNSLYQKYPYTNNVQFPGDRPLMLIGQDNCDLIASHDSVQPNRESPMLTKTLLGYVIHGPAKDVHIQADEIVSINACCEEKLSNLDDFVKRQMTLENFGVVVSNVDRQKSEDDRKAIAIVEASIKKLPDRYELALPYKTPDVKMVDSYNMAYNRMKCTERKISKANIVEKYNDSIDDYLKKQYAIKIDDSQAIIQRDNTWYLPHFPVINVNKPGKIRVVFDAAAKANGYSLNDYILTGPDLVPSLFGIISRFREKPIAVCADIVEMFPQVRIAEADTWSQCFLWRNMETHRQPDVYKMQSMIFGATSSPFMAQFVKNFNAEQFRSTYPEAANAIINQHYVDDFIMSFSTIEDTKRIVDQVIHINQQAGFQLRGFVSNSGDALEELPESIIAGTKMLTFDGEESSHRVLGVRWDPVHDEFNFHYNFHNIPSEIIEGTKTPTKRDVLRIAMSIFDPVGFISTLTITARIILQHIWKSGVGWDDEIPNTLSTRWIQWLKQLSTIHTVKIQRCLPIPLQQNNDVKYELHTFCDASESAYSAVIYLRVLTTNNVDVGFLTAKARVAPLKTLTIPRLELIAAVLGTRLAQLAKSELGLSIHDEFYWTDSKTVLAWIRTNKKLTSFISSRVGEIVENTKVANWKWVPTKMNPADKATRENYNSSLVDDEWLYGPNFLKQDLHCWPTESKPDDIKTENDKMPEEIEDAFMMPVQQNLNGGLQGVLPNPNNVSNYLTLIGATMRIQRFFKNKTFKTDKDVIFSPADYAAAENVWYKAIQQNFSKTILDNVKQYEPYTDNEGILRVGGRLKHNMDMEKDLKHPIILDGKHGFVRLLIQHYHHNCMHQGRETVLNMLRQKFYFPKMRAAIKSVINSCQVCIKRRKMPTAPCMGNLPNIRLTPNLPVFTYVGVDFFGPMTVQIGRRQEKRWGVIFTCMVSRAVHLELTSSLSADYTIMVIRRFQSRRGIPKIFLCDNGTNFHGAQTELSKARKEMDLNKIQQFSSDKGTSWRFIPPSSPNFGGCWERLVRTVKTALSAVLVEKSPKEETLQTFLVEVENLINDRPITFVSTNPEDETALTPNMILKGRDDVQLIPGHFGKRDEFMRKQWRKTQHWLDCFWARWLKEYVPNLLPKRKWTAEGTNMKVGDIVKINEPNQTRGEWPLGRVIRIYPGSDNIVRVVDLKTKNGVLKRPVSKLAPIVLAEGEESISCIDQMESIPGGEYVTAKTNVAA